MAKVNCWEFRECGRQPGGAKALELGICPATSEAKVDGVNGGKNGGRACWGIAGTLCGGKVQGTFAEKMVSCYSCEFYKSVLQDEGKGITRVVQIQEALK